MNLYRLSSTSPMLRILHSASTRPGDQATKRPGHRIVIGGAAFALTLLAALFLSGCAAQEAPSFFQATASLPGARLSLVKEAPSGYAPTPLPRVYFHRQQGEDIWLLAPEETLTALDGDGSFRAWLRAARAVRFQTDAGDVYWVPIDRDADALAMILDHDLAAWVDSDQLAGLWTQRGDALRTDRAFAEAIEAYAQALSLNPNLVEAHVGMGAALLAVGRAEEALQHLLFATREAPAHYWAQRLLGNAYLNLYRYALAVGPLTRAYLLRPETPDLLIGAALGLGRSGRRDAALRVLDKAEMRIDAPHQLQAIRALREEFSGPKD
ncbi:MAG TPA: tetratricopeptide repeat protein [Anaerolineae bacterium]|nr:tetratricopeptide repeat protein [Anaerolineae bacterium]